MSFADSIASALRSQSSPLLHAHVASLACLLAEAAERTLTPGEVRARLDAEPRAWRRCSRPWRGRPSAWAQRL